MALTIGGSAGVSTLSRIKTTAPKPQDVFKDLTKAKAASDYYSPSPASTAAARAAENPAYGQAQKILGDINGLARQASDPNISAEQRDALNTQFNDYRNQLRDLGIGNGQNPSSNPNATLSEYDLGLNGYDLKSPANAQAAQTAADGAFGGLLQQQSGVQSEAYRLDNQDRESAAQQFSTENFLDSQRGERNSEEDSRINSAVTAYKNTQSNQTKRDGVLKLLT